MADRTHIEWTDATWNVITGCSVVSAGCKHCYAMKLAGTRLQHDPSRAGLTVQTQAGPVWNGQVRFNEQWLDQPLRWKRPRRIFVCAHGDLFHESVPDWWIDQVFMVMATAPQHTFQVLTKRPARMLSYLRHAELLQRLDATPWPSPPGPAAHKCFQQAEGLEGWPLPNVWLGVSVEDQAAADERIPPLLQCPAAVRWISAEPLLGPIDLGTVHRRFERGYSPWSCLDGYCLAHSPRRRCGCPQQDPAIDWVVAGGESGHGARPMHPDWARSLRDQCAEAGVAFVFKQWGAWAPLATQLCEARALSRTTAVSATGRKDDRPAGAMKTSDALMELVGKKAAGRLLDGVQHDGYPEVRHG